MAANTVHYLQPDELKKLLKVAADSKRNTAMILLSYRHALRASEVCGLSLADFDEAHERLVITARKKGGNGARYFEAFRAKDSYGPSDVAAVHAWLKEREDKYPFAESCDALFLSRKTGPMRAHSWHLTFKLMAEEAGLREEVQHPHVLRHTSLMAMVRAGIPLHIVSGVARHASLSSLKPYIEPQQNEIDAAAVKAFAKF
jgi:site-specific recombinase XerD